MMFLLGRQAMLWHEPPMYLRSIKATRSPCCAVVHAATFAPVPLPSTIRSYSSVFGTWVEGFIAIWHLFVTAAAFRTETLQRTSSTSAHLRRPFNPGKYVKTR